MADKVIDCGELLTIADVGNMYAELLEAMIEGETVCFDCSEVKRIDTAGLQMLFSYAREIKSQGGEMLWNSPSKNFVDSAKLLGLADEMNLGVHS